MKRRLWIFSTVTTILFLLMSTISNPIITKASEQPSVDFSVSPSANEYVLSPTGEAKGSLDIQVTPSGSSSQMERDPIDVVFVHDTSGSMNWYLDGQKKSVSAQTALMSALSYFNSNSKAGDHFYFVPFNNDVRKNGDVRAVESLKTIEQRARHLHKENNNSGGTNYTQALEYAKNLLANSSNKKKYIIFLTDGAPTVLTQNGYKYILYTNGQALYEGSTSSSNYSKAKKVIEDTALQTSESLERNNITMYSIGFANNEDYDFKLLENMSTKTGGYAVRGTTENLTDVFDKISKKIDSYTLSGEVTVDLKEFAGKVVVDPEANVVVDSNQVAHIPFKFNFPDGAQPDPSKLVTSLPLIFKGAGTYTFHNIKLAYDQLSTPKVHQPITVEVKKDMTSIPGVEFSVQPSAEEYVKMPSENANGSLDFNITPFGMAPKKQRNPIDVVFVHDTSGSMADKLDNTRKDTIAKNALLSSLGYFRNNTINGDQFYFVPFDSDVSHKTIGSKVVEPTVGIDNIENVAKNLDYSYSYLLLFSKGFSEGGTNYTQALEEAMKKFNPSKTIARDKYVIFLTDGEPSNLTYNNKDYVIYSDGSAKIDGRGASLNQVQAVINDQAINSAAKLGENQVTMYSIALANEGDVNFNLLQNMSAKTGGYAIQANSNNLTSVFNQISEKIDSSTISGKISVDLKPYNGNVIVDSNSNYVANDNQVIEIPFKFTFPVGEKPNPELIQASLPLQFKNEGSYEFKDNVKISYTGIDGQFHESVHAPFTVKVRDETAPYFKSEVDIKGNKYYSPDSLVKNGTRDSETNEFTVNYKLMPETIFTKETKGTVNQMKIIQPLPEGISLATENPISLFKNGSEALTDVSVKTINNGKDLEISLGDNAITYEPSDFSIKELNLQLKLKVDWALDFTEFPQAKMSFNDSRFQSQEQYLNMDEQLISMRVYLFGMDYQYIGDHTGNIEKIGASDGEFIADAQVDHKPVKGMDLINEGKTIEITYSDDTKALLHLKSDFIIRNLSLGEDLESGATTKGHVAFKVTDLIAGTDVKYEYKLKTDKEETEWATFDPNATIELPKDMEGKVEIQVRTSGGFSLNSEPIIKTVTIIKEAIEISPNPIEVEVGKSIAVKIKLTPDDDVNRTYDVQVEDPTIAKYENGKVSGIKEGETKLIVTTQNMDGEEIKKEVILRVNQVLVTDITVEPNPVNLDKFEIFNDFNVVIKPDNATNKELDWESNDSSIVEVLKNGEIKGMATGTTEVRVSSADGLISTVFTVNVGAPLRGISASDITLIKGETDDANKYIVKIPSDATNVKGSPTFTSSDHNIVDVDINGGLEAKRLGQATIFITVLDENDQKYSAQLIVHVVEKDSNNADDGRDKY